MNFSEIVAKIDRACGTNSTSYTLANKATDVNIALRDLVAIALRNKHVNYDDSNHTHDPFITLNLENGYRNYYLSLDEDSNLILCFNKVMVADSSGKFHDVTRVNHESDSDMEDFNSGNNVSGMPTKFSQVGMGIFFNYVPNYSYTGGIKAYIDREPSFFISSDTTKTAGIDGLAQNYLYLKPSYEYCRDKGKSNAERLFRDINLALKDAENRLLGGVTKDVPRRLVAACQNNR